MESWKIDVGKGVGDCCTRLLLSESLVTFLDDNDDVLTFVDPHAASKTTSERLSSSQYFFSLKQQPFLLFAFFVLQRVIV